MRETYVCVGGLRNGKSYHRALEMAQTIMQEYPNQSVCVISLDDYKKALADEREKVIEELARRLNLKFVELPLDDSIVLDILKDINRVAGQMKGETE